MRNLLADIRHAVRRLLGQPSFSIAAILTLALGIGLTTTIFGVVNGIVLRPLAFPNASRLVTICEQYPSAPADWCSISPPNVEDIAARSRSIVSIGIARDWPYHLETTRGAEGIRGGLATPGLFSALGVHPELGRAIEQSDLIGRESSVALITHELWQTRFGGSRDVLGRRIVLDGVPVSIVGVLPAGFEVPPYSGVQLWRPLPFDPRDETNRAWRGFVAYARLAPGASLATARRELGGIADQLRIEHFTGEAFWNLTTMSLQDLVIGSVKPVLYVFLGAVLLVLLIACANVANLLLARAANRSPEMALRAALGAGRWRLVRGLLVESGVLALAGTIVGVLLAFWGTAAFVALAPPSIPRIAEVRVDGRVLTGALALACLTTLLFGLAPALRTARGDVAQALRQGSRGSARGGSLGRVLVVSELAIALTLTMGAALLTRSFAARTAWNPGFEREHLLTFSVFAPTEKFGEGAGIARLWRRIEGELRAIPGVVGAGSASAGPLFGSEESDDVRFDGAAGPATAPARWYDVSPDFFQTLGVPIVRGRALTESDAIGAPNVALVNESLARRFWPDDTPIGKRITLFDGRLTVHVVGVVRDVPPATPDAPVKSEIYWSNRQQPRAFSFFLVRTTVPPASIAAAVRERLRGVDRDLEAGSVRPMSTLMAGELRAPRFQLLLLVTFGGTALVLAAIGTYGLLAYTVSRRMRELGIRIALGAEQRQVLGAVLGDALRLAVAGVLIGSCASMVLARAMHGMVAGVSTFDPLSLAASVLLLLAIAVAACLGPAFRAARVDPVVTLAAE